VLEITRDLQRIVRVFASVAPAVLIPAVLIPVVSMAAPLMAALLMPGTARAAGETPDAAGAPKQVRVWYRSSEGCPDGQAFIELLRRFGRGGLLAGVGDRVDFVVTVAHGPAQSTGRLERQSSDRTVAIRDAVAATCGEVAEVLALSLDLALDPAAPSTLSGDVGSAPTRVPASPSDPEQGRLNAASDPEGNWVWRLGVQGTLTTGVARTVSFGAATFLDLRRAPDAWSLRLSLTGALGQHAGAVPLDVGLLASRLEACWTWDMGELALGPCVGVEAGVIHARGSGAGALEDTGFWSAGVLHARGSWQLGRVVALEAQVGALVPFLQYQFEAVTGGEVTASAPLGLETALGLSFRL
jgi:hypothetical protein